MQRLAKPPEGFTVKDVVNVQKKLQEIEQDLDSLASGLQKSLKHVIFVAGSSNDLAQTLAATIIRLQQRSKDLGKLEGELP